MAGDSEATVKNPIVFHTDMISDLREATQADYDAAEARIRAALPRLAVLDARIVIDMGRGHALTIEAKADPEIIAGALEEAVNCRMTIHPLDIIRIANCEIDARQAYWYSFIKVVGSNALAVQFGDLIGAGIITPAPSLSGPVPALTADIDQARSDLNEFGYALIRDTLTPAQVEALRTRMYEQAAGEAEIGQGIFDGGPDLPNQRVLTLINKGDAFVELLENPVIDAIAPGVIGDHYQISSYTGNIAGPGGEPQTLHMEQNLLMPAIRGFPVGLLFAWFLDDFTPENGATRIVPRSHTGEVKPHNPLSSEETIPAVGPKGTCLVFESRTWHGTGANITTRSRAIILLYLVRYWVRPQENGTISTDPAVEATLSDKVKVLLGHRATSTLGGIEGRVNEGTMLVRPEKPMGVLKPRA